MTNENIHYQKLPRLWIIVVCIALLWRIIVLASGAVSFHSDEAIVGLMARHINLGQSIPVFFYGQPYMGSLDPLLVSVTFRLFGESVLSIRIVQSALYLLTIITTMLLARRITQSDRIAAVSGLLLALPPTLVSLYTTISLGGYGELLLIGNLLLLVGYEIGVGKSKQWHWLLLGGLVGLGWWTNNLIVVYASPVALFIISSRKLSWRGLGLTIIAFCVCSAPWWIYNLNHDWQSVRFLLGGFQDSATGHSIGIPDRLIGLFLLGIPAVIGVRYPWATTAWAGTWSILVVLVYVLILVQSRRKPTTKLLWLLLGSVAVIFVLSSFGVDATGRYLLPIVIPLAVLGAIGAFALPRNILLCAISIIIGTNIVGTALALRNVPPGLTPQFDPATDFSNAYDNQVIAFLKANVDQYAYGYATYWVSYRLAFLSKETIILSPQLPYKSTLIYAGLDRYPAYTVQVESAEHPVFVTANLPQLDAVIIDRLAQAKITFRQQHIGPYTVFYDLSRRIAPAELGLQNLP